MIRKSEILDRYAAYLDEQGITYHTRNGFSVRFSLSHVDFAYIDVREKNGQITVWDYFGTCYTGVREANLLAKELQTMFPEYHVWVEKYTTYEIDVEDSFRFTTIEGLHEKVCRLAAAVDEGAGIGFERLGDNFDR